MARTHVWRLTLLVGVLASFLPSDALACKVTHVASAKEIVALAEEIVRVRAVSYSPPASPEPGRSGAITMEIVQVLKGSLPMKPFAVDGRVDHYDGANDRTAPYDLVRPGGRHGNCHADDYKLGAEYLLFLRGPTPYWAPLAATNEEISGDNDPWLVWVKRQVKGSEAGRPTKSIGTAVK
jgi:hypothetical protein